jgi:hypothetical protein
LEPGRLEETLGASRERVGVGDQLGDRADGERITTASRQVGALGENEIWSSRAASGKVKRAIANRAAKTAG